MPANKMAPADLVIHFIYTKVNLYGYTLPDAH